MKGEGFVRQIIHFVAYLCQTDGIVNIVRDNLAKWEPPIMPFYLEPYRTGKVKSPPIAAQKKT